MRKNKQIKKICKCGKVFFVAPSKQKRKHCSMECMHLYKNSKVNITCKCGKVFQDFPSQNTKYCSIKCSVAFRNYKGNKNPKWRGGIVFDRKRKLIYNPNHPHPNFDGIYCYEYNLIMEKYIGRYLKKEERVHHINYDETDNRIENLQLMKNQREHQKLHMLQKKW